MRRARCLFFFAFKVKKRRFFVGNRTAFIASRNKFLQPPGIEFEGKEFEKVAFKRVVAITVNDFPAKVFFVVLKL